MTKVVLGPKTLLEKGLYEINEQRVNKVVLFSSSETLRIPYIKDFHKTIENKIYQVFDQVCCTWEGILLSPRLKFLLIL